MLSTIERCWFVGIRMFLRRCKCAVWRPSDYVRWNDCFKEERAVVTVQVRGIVYYTPSSREKSTIMVSCLFIEFLCYCRGIDLLMSRIIFRSVNSSIERIWIWITSYYHEFSVRIRNWSRRIFGEYYEFCSLLSRKCVGMPHFALRILSLVMGWFSNLSLLSHHWLCNLVLVSCFGVWARDQSSKLFGRLLARSGANVNNAHARMYITIRIRVTCLVPSLIS